MGKAKQQGSTAWRQDKSAAARKPEARTSVFAHKPWSLTEYGLRGKAVKADGNCFFRACADQLEVRDVLTFVMRARIQVIDTSKHHMNVFCFDMQGAWGDHMAYRQCTVTFMRQHRDDFEPYMEDGEGFDRYCSRMSQVWLLESGHCECAWSHQASMGSCEVLSMKVYMHNNSTDVEYAQVNIDGCASRIHGKLPCRMAHGQAIRSRWPWHVSMES